MKGAVAQWRMSRDISMHHNRLSLCGHRGSVGIQGRLSIRTVAKITSVSHANVLFLQGKHEEGENSRMFVSSDVYVRPRVFHMMTFGNPRIYLSPASQLGWSSFIVKASKPMQSSSTSRLASLPNNPTLNSPLMGFLQLFRDL